MTATRGWREERVTWSRDTTGRPVPLFTGITRDERGKDVPALGVGLSETALLTAGLRDQLWENMRLTLNDAAEVRRQRPPGADR
ncbi:hypothetical protein [Amycolatopsis sp. NPDC051128]|uniref:hypothetical protein n=1 Tax=Amycolatopsis sp. NPDC051128 TaxID=3155412 RepID=UPI0034221F45